MEKLLTNASVKLYNTDYPMEIWLNASFPVLLPYVLYFELFQDDCGPCLRERES